MSPTPKTIQIFLPGGDPQGIRIAEITTRIVQVIEIPRSLIGEFLKMPESEQVGIYYLIGGSEEDNPKVYIGQTGELRKRLNQHNKDPKKDFWERALVLISRTNSLTTTHTLFLEWHSLQTVKQADRYTDENSTSGSNPHTPAPLESECLEIFDTGKTLLATLGYPIFDPVAKTASRPKQEEVFFCKASGSDGRGLYTQEGFVVLKGSIGRLKCVPSFEGGTWETLRQRMVKSGIMRKESEKLVFTKDHLFKTPSMAAAFLAGRTANGWTEWKTETGHTLDQVKRQTP